MSAPARQSPIAIAWSDDGLIGGLRISGELWAAVDWSEKRQQWCIEDAEGRCLRHTASIRGATESKEAAVALAEAMIRDGRMPTPEQARAEHNERRRAAREKRQRQRAQIRKREEAGRHNDTMWNAYSLKYKEDEAQPLYEMLPEAFDFADPELWKSNSFASLRPRLVLHLKAAIASLEHDLAFTIRRTRSQTAKLALETKLARRGRF
jgi:hypothetical protein